MLGAIAGARGGAESGVGGWAGAGGGRFFEGLMDGMANASSQLWNWKSTGAGGAGGETNFSSRSSSSKQTCAASRGEGPGNPPPRAPAHEVEDAQIGARGQAGDAVDGRGRARDRCLVLAECILALMPNCCGHSSLPPPCARPEHSRGMRSLSLAGARAPSLSLSRSNPGA